MVAARTARRHEVKDEKKPGKRKLAGLLRFSHLDF
jgi:hypothetical protein